MEMHCILQHSISVFPLSLSVSNTHTHTHTHTLYVCLSVWLSLSLSLYIYIYTFFHQVRVLARNSLTLCCDPPLSSVAFGRSICLRPVSRVSPCWLTNTRASMCRNLFKNVANKFDFTSPTVSSMFVVVTWIVCEMGGK